MTVSITLEIMVNLTMLREWCDHYSMEDTTIFLYSLMKNKIIKFIYAFFWRLNKWITKENSNSNFEFQNLLGIYWK